MQSCSCLLKELFVIKLPEKISKKILICWGEALLKVFFKGEHSFTEKKYKSWFFILETITKKHQKTKKFSWKTMCVPKIWFCHKNLKHP